MTEAQLLRCSCRFTSGQSELSFIIIEPRREQTQGQAHLAMPTTPSSEISCKRETVLDKSNLDAATWGGFSVRSGLW